ncbi:MAG: hypothetical protein ABW133_26185, partial [Polyangiaceae bacterium]
MRSFRLALAFLVVGASGCSLALDTDALKKGTGGAGGSGGSGGTGGTLDGGAEGGVACNSDLDCQPVDAVNGCNRYQCGPNKTCTGPVPYSGLGVVSIAGNVAETADEADDIGMPVLLADGTDLILAAWKKNGATTNIVIRKYDEDRPELSAVTAELNAITMGRFESVSSSPALIVRGVPRKLRMLGAAKPTGVAATGMYQLDVDLANLRMSAMQPAKADVGVTGYDTNPRGPAPRFLPTLVGEPAGMWIQQGKLFGFDATGGGELFGSKRVIGFAPLAANAGLHAALETTELGSTDDQGQTELWTRNSPSLTSLINDQPGARRRGVATTATGAEGSGGPLNFVVWAFEKAGTASLFYAAAGCDANSCASIGSPAGTGDVILPATDPAVASARVGMTSERDLAVTFELSGPDPLRPGMTNTALIGGLSRLGPNPDGGTLASTALNPPSFIVAYT